VRAASKGFIGYPVHGEPVISASMGAHNPMARAASARKEFKLLFARSLCEQLSGGEPQQGMAPIGRNFGEWDQHEPALM
jgi:hypothetical protein